MKTIFAILFFITGTAVVAQTGGYKVGDIATDFNLKNIDGNNVKLADYKEAKGYIVVFTCNTCPYSIAYQDRIIALSKEFGTKGYPVLAINPNDPGTAPAESYEKMQERAKEKNFNFPYLMDPDHLITKAYGASRTPHVFVLQKTAKGNVVEYIGAIDDDTEGNNIGSKYIESAVNSLLIGQKPAVATTKAIGCTIKWKKTSL